MGLTKVLSILLIFFFSCRQEKEIHITGSTMGTTYNIKYINAPGVPDRQFVADEISRILVYINSKLSTYIKDSEISRFNRHREVDKPFPIGAEFYRVVKHGLDVAYKTDGAFDPTLGPLINLWGFGPSGEKKIPSSEEIAEVKKKVGYKKLNLQGKFLKKSVPEMYLDLSASAKGHGVDKIVDLLIKSHVESYMVEIGGEVRAKGKWSIGIDVPGASNRSEELQKILKLSNHAVATSGSYRNFFKKENKKYTHIIDFKTYRPIQNNLISVTVVDKVSCMNADAWATALMAMGKSQGFEYAQKNNIAAYFVYRSKDGQTLKTLGSDRFTDEFGK